MEADIEHLRGWIGREERGEELVTRSMVERFTATFDLEEDTRNGAAIPVLSHVCLTVPSVPTAKIGTDGHPARGDFLPPVPLPRRMWAGGHMAFHDDIRVGETVARTSRIKDVLIKKGRSGTLCFVTVEHLFEADGRRVISERQDIVFRGMDLPGGGLKPVQPAPEGHHRRMVEPTQILLFRYSALTFNGHRIHYDAPYARDVESYPGLIVHGPMQATMLAQFAADIRGRSPTRFEFRSLSPLFDDRSFTLNARDDVDGLKLWTAAKEGPVAMEARASW
ncbi:FAS1-like dehydratase domain-containing protein [Tianweitania sediminis]|uniref:MaoC family dehydratase N-terminal domain-containing protein n=1 Tax=Tianweitania sediminis TaxID=1502156 RepID=A0A8J7R1V8_9HYPH|nr:MaoC family dehydratase N-terminal domain-containing protein [Tianweitania sediminis]MBP0439922.1 MaoC family dehydratase N-terminal domain-containing protein [Tianweitania sediminis]